MKALYKVKENGGNSMNIYTMEIILELSWSSGTGEGRVLSSGILATTASKVQNTS